MQLGRHQRDVASAAGHRLAASATRSVEHDRLGPGHARSGRAPARPATYVGGRFSTHCPGPPSRSWVARAEARIAARESTTRFGRPGRAGGLDRPAARGRSAASHSRGAGRGSPRRVARDRPQAAHGGTGYAVPDIAGLAGSTLVATAAQWIEGARPRTLPAAVAPVLAGTGVALYDGEAVWWKALLALVVALALQVGVNYANDYSDGIRGTDDDRVGPLRLVGSGRRHPGAVKRPRSLRSASPRRSAWCSPRRPRGGWSAVGALCVLAAWFYTGGSRPYGYLGLGEVMVFVFFGLVAVVGTTYVQTESLRRCPPGTPRSGSARWPARSWSPTTCATSPPTGRPASAPWRCVLGDARTRRLYALLVGAAAGGAGRAGAGHRGWRCSGWLRAAGGARGPDRAAGRPAGPWSRCCSGPGRRAALRGGIFVGLLGKKNFFFFFF